MRRLLSGALLCAALAGCDDPLQDCVARGAATTYTGSVSYAGQTGTAPVTGALPLSIVVYDLTQACTYDSMQFTLGIGDCLLWATVDASSDDGGSGLSATLAPYQQCSLPLADGAKARVTLAPGTLDYDGSVLQLTLAGKPSDGGGDGAYLQWSFTGG